MQRMKSELEVLQNLYGELLEIQLPKGFASVTEDLDIEIFEYDSYIMGLVSSYITNNQLEIHSIDLGRDIDQKLEECMTKVKELSDYKNKLTKMALILCGIIEKDN